MRKIIYIFLFLIINNSFAYAENQIQKNLMQCSSIAYVIQFGFPGNEKMGEMLTKTQFFYDDLYELFRKSDSGMTQGEFSDMKSNVILSLGEMYDKDINSLYKLENYCNLWRIKIFKVGKELLSDIRKMPNFPDGDIKNKERFESGKKLIDVSFKNWSDPTLNRLEMARPTPKKIKELMFELLNKPSN